MRAGATIGPVWRASWERLTGRPRVERELAEGAGEEERVGRGELGGAGAGVGAMGTDDGSPWGSALGTGKSGSFRRTSTLWTRSAFWLTRVGRGARHRRSADRERSAGCLLRMRVRVLGQAGAGGRVCARTRRRNSGRTRAPGGGRQCRRAGGDCARKRGRVLRLLHRVRCAGVFHDHPRDSRPDPDERDRRDDVPQRPRARAPRRARRLEQGDRPFAPFLRGRRGDRHADLPRPPSRTRAILSADVRADALPCGASAAASSATFANRRDGSLSRQRSTAASTGAGTSPRIEPRRGAASLRTAADSAANVSPSNGGAQAISSCKIAPRAHMSERASTSFDDSICSGDMQFGEPIVAVAAVVPASRLGKLLGSPSRSRSRAPSRTASRRRGG